MVLKVYDTHTHSEGRSIKELKEMAEKGIVKINSCAFYPVRPMHYGTLIDLFRKLQEFETERGDKAGLKIYPAIGIHPRCIPPEWEKVIDYMEDYQPKILGEIGLEEGNDLERRVLEAQLSIAAKHDIPCIIHTPRKNKLIVTEKLLDILERISFPAELAVIDHLSHETVSKVFKRGHYCGLTVEKGKLTPEEVLDILKEFEAERFMLNSDSGFGGSEYLSVLRTAEFLLESGLGDDVKKVSIKNAEAFFKN